jgi:serine/threonine protein kinase
MAIDTVASFVDVLRQHRLLEPEQLEEVERKQSKAADARVLAKALINKGWLTPYQVNEIGKGQAAGLVIDQYRILERLGEGGMGQVFKARHAAMGRVVALKVIRKERLENAEAVKRFEREIKAAGQLHHPNIVLAFDASQVGNTHYLVMEYVNGIDLAHLVREKGPLPVAQACDYIRQAAEGLQFAHERGMIHRDIKPANLLLEKKDEANGKASDGAAKLKKPGKPLVKILDMGLARLQPHEQGGEEGTALSVDGRVMGTPDFMAPEQAKNSHQVDLRVDIYSLGCTFYFLLTRKTPFSAATPLETLLRHQMDTAPPLSQFRDDVPPGVQEVLDRMLAKRPEDRYQSAAELVAALTPYCEGGTEVETQVTARPRLQATMAGGGGTAVATEVVAHPLATAAELANSTARHPPVVPLLRRMQQKKKLAVVAAAACLVLGGVLLIAWSLSTTSTPTGGVAGGTNSKETGPTHAKKAAEPPPPPPLARCLPETTNLAVYVSVPDIMRSSLVRRVAERNHPTLDELRQHFRALLNVDISENVQRAVVACPVQGHPDEALVVFQGTFDAEKSREVLRSRVTHKLEGTDEVCYEYRDAGDIKPKYIAILGTGTLAISTQTATLAHAVERAAVSGGKRAGSEFKDRDFQRLFDFIDGKGAGSVQVMAGGSFAFKPDGKTLQEEAGLRSAALHARIAEGRFAEGFGGAFVRAQFLCKDAAAARGLEFFLRTVVGLLSSGDKKLAPLAQAFSEVSFTVTDTTVAAEKRFTYKELERLLGLEKAR